MRRLLIAALVLPLLGPALLTSVGPAAALAGGDVIDSAECAERYDGDLPVACELG